MRSDDKNVQKRPEILLFEFPNHFFSSKYRNYRHSNPLFPARNPSLVMIK